jgi:hypothetical protein
MLATAAACNAGGQGSGTAGGEEGGTASVLVPTMEVRVAGDTVHFHMQISNASDTVVVMEFPSAQRYDFAVDTETGESVWRWSADRTFGQVLGEERLAPGASLSYRESWYAGGRSGALVARGEVVSTNHPQALQTSFEVGG